MHETETRPRWIVPMRPRSPDEVHRAATPLELFFDLVFVVAVAQAANALHHGISEGHTLETLVGYCLIFFGIWWAWMNFTWFATSYDNNDVPYRLLVFVQMTGALIVASGVQPVVNDRDLTIPVIGYVIMRLAGVTQWIRVAYSDPVHRPTAIRYAAGIALCQLAWILLLFTPNLWHVPGFIVLAVVELVIPIWAEIASPTPWHVGHVRERYGLFTILVLGESILSTSFAIQSAADEGGMTGGLISVVIGALLIVYAMWWLYFYQPLRHIATSIRVAFIWAYGHVFTFGATAAVGAGLAVPSAIYVISLWLLQEHPRRNSIPDMLVHPITAFLILLTPFTGQPALLIGILLTALVIIRLVRHLDME